MPSPHVPRSTGLLFPVSDLEGNEWEEHPQFCLTGEGNSVATKTQQPSAQLPEWHNTLVTNRVMDPGIHRISLVYTVTAKPPWLSLSADERRGGELETVLQTALSRPVPG